MDNIINKLNARKPPPPPPPPKPAPEPVYATWASGLRESVQAAPSPPDVRAAQAAIRGPPIPYDIVAHIEVSSSYRYQAAAAESDIMSAEEEAELKRVHATYRLPRRWTLEDWRALGGDEPEWDLVRPAGVRDGPGMFYRSELHAERAVARFLRITEGILATFDAFKERGVPRVVVSEWTDAKGSESVIAHAGTDDMWFRRSHVVGSPDDDVRDTFLHELAHVIVRRSGMRQGHSPAWARTARSLGCTGSVIALNQWDRADQFNTHVYHQLAFRCNADPAMPHIILRTSDRLRNSEGRARCELHAGAERDAVLVPSPDWPYAPRFAVFDCGGTRKVYLVGEEEIPLDESCEFNAQRSGVTLEEVRTVNAYLNKYRGRAWPYPNRKTFAVDAEAFRVSSTNERCYEFRCSGACRFLLPESFLAQRALLQERCVCDTHKTELTFFPDARRHEPPRVLIYACQGAPEAGCERAVALGSRFLTLDVGDATKIQGEDHVHRDGTAHPRRIDRVLINGCVALRGREALTAVLDADLLLAMHLPPDRI